jgi:hypothetical protein
MTAKTRAIPSLHRDNFWPRWRGVPGLCPVLASGNTTSPYCRAVRFNDQAASQVVGKIFNHKLTLNKHMENTVERIQKWFKINCNDDWEHTYGLSICTLDNPGWEVKIDLTGTSLENLSYSKEFQDTMDKNHWYRIRTNDNVLEMFCGPENLDQILLIFLDEILNK